MRDCLVVGDHNYCRNPDNRLSSPWCFTEAESLAEETCSVRPCQGIHSPVRRISMPFRSDLISNSDGPNNTASVRIVDIHFMTLYNIIFSFGIKVSK